MRAARAILLYALAVIVVGALLAPWLFWLVQWLAAHTETFAGWTRHPFKRIFNRSLMIVALAGLWPLLRSLGYRAWSEIGFPRRDGWWRQILAGFGFGLLSLSVAALVTGRNVDWSGATLGLAGQLLLTAAVVSVLEETFFRGGLQGALQRGLPRYAALLIVSVIYSALHFLKPAKVQVLPADVQWFTGLTWLGEIVSKSFARPGVVVGFVTLCLAGGVLGLAFLRTDALYLSVGLHAGWVVPNEFVRALGGGSIIEDWRTWPVLVVLLLGLWRWQPRS